MVDVVLQLFIDYNLFGMNFINVDAVKFRQPLPSDSTPATGMYCEQFEVT